MKRRFALLSLCAFALVLIPGCDAGKLLPPSDPVEFAKWLSKNKVTISSIVHDAAEFGTKKGLDAWAKKDPAGAKEASLALSKNINDQILPYFKDGSKLLTAAEVKQFLSSSLFKNVPDAVKIAIISASAVLDFYCPIPDSASYLSQDQKDVVCAFFTGVRDGCDDFNTPDAGTREVGGKRRSLPKSAWIE
jgi:hypothetical protein